MKHNMRERLLQDFEQDKKDKAVKEQDTHGKDWLDSPWVKGTGYFLLTVGILWGSGWFFSAMGYSIRSFKKMVKKV